MADVFWKLSKKGQQAKYKINEFGNTRPVCAGLNCNSEVGGPNRLCAKHRKDINPELEVAPKQILKDNIFWKANTKGQVVKHIDRRPYAIAACMAEGCSRQAIRSNKCGSHSHVPDCPLDVAPAHIKAPRIGDIVDETDNQGNPIRLKWCKNGNYKTKRRICDHKECETVASKGDNYCRQHGKPIQCSTPGCQSKARAATGQCGKHSGEPLCSEPGCRSLAKHGSACCIKHGGGYICTFPDCQRAARGTSNRCFKHSEPEAKEREYVCRTRKLREDINFRITQNLRSRVRDALKNNRKCAKTVELLGCSIEFFRGWLASKFNDGMTWDNYGHSDERAWQIDHIIPCASFDMSKEEDQRECFHYSNTQPLWSDVNQSKGAKLDFGLHPESLTSSALTQPNEP